MPIKKFPRSIGGFEILGSLGQGGMGIVYCARDTALERDLAIKVQSGDWAQHAEVKERFLREARILARINHPNVVQIYSVGEHEGAPFFVMEMLDGSVADAARVKMPGIGQLKRWMLEAARGLSAIHEVGVVHRDIKPANLLLTRATSVEEEHVKVADLGIASAGDLFGAKLTQVGAVMGTSGYLAPESFRIEHKLDGRADQYSLGVVFYELLARRGPHQDVSDAAMLAGLLEPRSAPDVREFRSEVDAETAHILATMLKHHPDDRFQSTPALVQALTSVQSAPQRMTTAVTVPVARPEMRKVDATAALPPPPTPVPSESPAVSAATTRRQVAAVKPASARRAMLIVLATALMIAAGTIWLYSGSHPAEVVLDTAKERTFTTPTAEPATQAQSLSSLQREASAKYLLGHYQLKTADGGEEWTMSFVEQDSAVIAAQLDGPEDEIVELTGQVKSQGEESLDGEDWDVYQVDLVGTPGVAVEMRVMFSDLATAGEGTYRDGAQRQRFSVESSEDL